MAKSTSVTHLLGDISGTAFWIAQCRALERFHAAPLFHDPWAADLAGERGRAIIDQLPGAKSHVWPLAMRTAILDRLITDQVNGQGFDTVINLAAGLDTRAFRLKLPNTLRWFDVDLPEISDHKGSILRGVQPSCRWEPVVADLTDVGERRRVLAELGTRGNKVLVITEGLLVYLTETQVAALAADLHAVPTFHTWVFDISSRAALQYSQRIWNKPLQSVSAPLQFGPLEGTRFFTPFGWQEAEAISLFLEGVRLKRAPRSVRLGMQVARLLAPATHAQFASSGIARMQRIG